MYYSRPKPHGVDNHSLALRLGALSFPSVLTKQCGVVPGMVDRCHHLIIISLEVLDHTRTSWPRALAARVYFVKYYRLGIKIIYISI